MEGDLRKVGLLLARVAVELIDPPLEMGMINTVSYLAILLIFIF